MSFCSIGHVTSSSRSRARPGAATRRQTEFPPTSGNQRPCRDVVRSPLALRCSREQNALHTLIRQRHLTPSCGGQVPTAENPGPGKDVEGELEPRPGTARVNETALAGKRCAQASGWE